MRYLALAVDYDGTAASDDKLSDAAALAIERLRISGRRVVLVTGGTHRAAHGPHAVPDATAHSRAHSRTLYLARMTDSMHRADVGSGDYRSIDTAGREPSRPFASRSR